MLGMIEVNTATRNDSDPDLAYIQRIVRIERNRYFKIESCPEPILESQLAGKEPRLEVRSHDFCTLDFRIGNRPYYGSFKLRFVAVRYIAVQKCRFR